MLHIYTYCVTIRPEVEEASLSTKTQPSMKEKIMSKAFTRARPVIEATVISVMLVVAALAVPAAIVYAAV